MRISALIHVLVILLAADLTAPTSAVAQVSQQRISWSKTSSGYLFRWNDRDLTATNAATGKTAYSVAEAVKREFGRPTADDVVTHYDVSFAPLSVVGPYLSYQRNDSWEGGAHPSGNERFMTVDVRNPKRAVRLTDLFAAEDIRSALLKDAVVQRVLRREKIATPATLQGLVKALANQQFGGEDDFMYVFPANLLENFAFHHVEKGRVAVRFLLSHGSEIYRFRNSQIGILLPIPDRLRAAFAQASVPKNGTLMKSLQQIAGDRWPTVVLRRRPD